jgi:16S rRNA processing protein RimM
MIVGKIVGTHALKGELKVISDFKEKYIVFKVGNIININNENYKIISVRYHKHYILIKLEGYNDINEVLKFIKHNIIINKETITLNEVTREDLINMEVYTDNYIGKVKEILISKLYDILVLDTKILIPNTKEFIKEIKDGKIYAYKVKGMTYED